jgi:preprotein translocase subunit SecY
MLAAFTNSLKIPELRNRIFFTLALLFIARVGANIPIPGVDPMPIKQFFETANADDNRILSFYNMFTGGALLNGALFALGIMPYISASIIMQLMGAVFPALAKLQREGEVGRQKIAQYTRYLTLLICIIQGLLLVIALRDNPGTLIQGFKGRIVSPDAGVWFILNSVIVLTTGTLILTWLGEQITQRGIGNGISLLITIGILADLPKAFTDAYSLIFTSGSDKKLVTTVVLIGVFLAVVAGIIAVTQAQRKIPVQYAKRVVGKKMYGGQASYLPLKVNYSGVMPVIFASAILMLPAQFLQYLGSAMENQDNWANDMASTLNDRDWPFYVLYALLILVFSYFWVSIMFKPIQWAEDLKKSGGYVPGVRPGEQTAKFLDHVMTRLTLAGAIFLTIIAVFPDLLLWNYKDIAGVQLSYNITQFFGGTGMLITVGVMLDTMRQVETFLLQRHYDGFLKKGKLRGRSSVRPSQMVESLEFKEFRSIWGPLLWVAGILFGLGLLGYFLK